MQWSILPLLQSTSHPSHCQVWHFCKCCRGFEVFSIKIAFAFIRILCRSKFANLGLGMRRQKMAINLLIIALLQTELKPSYLIELSKLQSQFYHQTHSGRLGFMCLQDQEDLRSCKPKQGVCRQASVSKYTKVSLQTKNLTFNNSYNTLLR